MGNEENSEAARSACRSCTCWRISRWTTTSSAVVGWSKITSSGRRASAIAMTTRWRIPPGELVRVRGDAPAVDPNDLEQVAASASASRLEIRSWAFIMSTNWSPTRITG